MIYLLTGYLWIVFSDKLARIISDNSNYLYHLQTYKGWLYVTITGLLFYYIMHRAMVELREKKNDLERQNRELSETNQELVKSNKEVRQLQEEIIYSFTIMLELHDQYTGGHSKNVAELAAGIAKELNLTDEKIQQAYWAGIVHDIGKILIPDNILNKTSSLTEDEYTLIKNHSYWGYKTLSQSKKLKEIAYYVLHHHEQWDGNGYPAGLKEDEIPLISQIISLADTWDAMTSNRSYRRALSAEEAQQELTKNKGVQFAPAVVDSFLKIVSSKSGQTD